MTAGNTVSAATGAVLRWLSGTDPLADPEVAARARLLFLDTLGCMASGLGHPVPRALAARLGATDPGAVRLPGVADGLGTVTAAYVAALSACWDEACEGLARAHGRPGLHAFAPVLALGLVNRARLSDTLRAFVAGYEIAARLGQVFRAPPGGHVDGTWGTFGAATAAAWLMAGNDERTRLAATAIDAAACQMPVSLYLPVAAGSTARNTYAAHAASQGVFLAQGAQAGLAAPGDALDELAARQSDAGEPPSAVAAPGEWLILQGYLKPFAAVRHVHYGAQAALDWRTAHDPGSAAVTRLRLEIYPEALTYCGNRAPVLQLQAQFSLSYGLAFTLATGGLGPEAYGAEAMADPEVRRLESLAELEAVEALCAGGKRAARLSVTRDGAETTAAVEALPGDPDRPLTQDQVHEKFLRYAAPTLGNKAERVAGSILNGALNQELPEVLAT